MCLCCCVSLSLFPLSLPPDTSSFPIGPSTCQSLQYINDVTSGSTNLHSPTVLKRTPVQTRVSHCGSSTVYTVQLLYTLLLLCTICFACYIYPACVCQFILVFFVISFIPLFCPECSGVSFSPCRGKADR